MGKTSRQKNRDNSRFARKTTSARRSSGPGESRELSDAAFNFLMGWIMFFCTDVLKVDPLLVGTLFAGSKVVDGVTDILAGFVVDRTNTKWGRGRPYDVCLIGAWLSIVFLFICPAGWSSGVKVVWVLLWYTLANSIFYTLNYRVVVIKAPLQGLCYTVRDAVDWWHLPTTQMVLERFQP